MCSGLMPMQNPWLFSPIFFTSQVISLSRKPILWSLCKLFKESHPPICWQKQQECEAVCSVRGNKLFKPNTLLRINTGTCCFIFFLVNSKTIFVCRLVFDVLARIVIRSCYCLNVLILTAEVNKNRKNSNKLQTFYLFFSQNEIEFLITS